MKIRFQADNDLRRQIVVAIRRHYPEIEIRSAQEADLDGLPDLAVLGMCANEGRILITHDVTTIGKSLRSLMDQSISSPGVFVVVPQDAAISQVILAVFLIWSASSPEEWVNRVTKIPF